MKKKKNKVTKKPVKKKNKVTKKPVKKKNKVTKKPVKKTKRVTKQTKKIKLLKEKFNQIDLRKVKNKDVKAYVKSLRKQYKEGEFQKKFTKYLWFGIQNYLSMYGKSEIKRFIVQSKISNQTFNKISRGQKVSKHTYKKFIEFVNNQFSQTELAFLWRITNLIKEGKGKVSEKRIRNLIFELYEFLNNELPDEDITIYDYLQVAYGH